MKRLLKFSIVIIALLFVTVPISQASNISPISNEYTDKVTIGKVERPLKAAYSIAVNSKGNLYISNDYNKIHVYKNNKFLYSLNFNTWGSLYMSIDHDDTLKVLMVRENIEFDFQGENLSNAIQRYNDYPDMGLIYSETTTDVYGNRYDLNKFLGFYKVTETSTNGSQKVVYQMKYEDWFNNLLITIASIIGFITFFLIVLLAVINIKSSTNKIYKANETERFCIKHKPKINLLTILNYPTQLQLCKYCGARIKLKTLYIILFYVISLAIGLIYILLFILIVTHIGFDIRLIALVPITIFLITCAQFAIYKFGNYNEV